MVRCHKQLKVAFVFVVGWFQSRLFIGFCRISIIFRYSSVCTKQSFSIRDEFLWLKHLLLFDKHATKCIDKSIFIFRIKEMNVLLIRNWFQICKTLDWMRFSQSGKFLDFLVKFGWKINRISVCFTQNIFFPQYRMNASKFQEYSNRTRTKIRCLHFECFF